MIQIKAKKIYTPDEYLDFEINSEMRHEYINGEIVPMTGGTPDHNKISGNLYVALRLALKHQPYETFYVDQRLWVSEASLYTYSDILYLF